MLVDVDGNGTLDLVRTTGTGVSVALNPGGTWSGFSTAVTVVAAGTVIAVGAGRVDAGTTTDLVLIDGNGPAQWRAATGTGPLAGRFPTATDIGVLSLVLDAGPYLKVTGDPVTLTIGDLSLTGGISVTQETRAGGVRVVTVVVTGLALDLGEGIGVVTLGGAMVVSPAGLAAHLELTAGLDFGSGITLSGDFYLDVNTGTAAVLVPDGLGGTTRVEGGPFVQVVAAPLVITFGTGGPVLSASVSVRSATGAGGTRTTVIAVSGGTFTLPSVQATPVLSGVNGILVLAPDGLAGRVSGTLTLAAGTLPAGVALAGTFGLAINRTSREVHESVTLDGTTVAMDLPVGPLPAGLRRGRLAHRRRPDAHRQHRPRAVGQRPDRHDGHRLHRRAPGTRRRHDRAGAHRERERRVHPEVRCRHRPAQRHRRRVGAPGQHQRRRVASRSRPVTSCPPTR